ncbi:MAG: hypothetical protein GXY76_15010 [Chloroflexi bacterium]|nr:hypothetical protein [Chloroflexota bacterium]
MSRFRYDTSHAWYKGNTHIHTTASDGGHTSAEVARMYAEQGYHFLFHADHWVASDVAAEADPYPLLWLDGIELHGDDRGGNPYHIVCLGRFQGLDREIGLVAALEAARAQDGLIILAHPDWIGNTLEDALRYGFAGVEVYNHVCRWLNGKSSGEVYWHAMLERNPATLGLAVDDAHIRPEHPGWNGGWIMVNAPACTPEAVVSAVRAGNFYSTLGPEFHDIRAEGRRVTIQTSPVQFARLVGPRHLGARIGDFGGTTFTTATFDVPESWSYAYLEIEDVYGKRAWTNALFVQD